MRRITVLPLLFLSLSPGLVTAVAAQLPPPPGPRLTVTAPLLVDMHLTATVTSSREVLLGWVSPDQANQAIVFDVLRADGSGSYQTITPAKQAASKFLDGHPGILGGVTLNYKIMAYYPSGLTAITNPLPVVLPMPIAQVLPGAVRAPCQGTADLGVITDGLRDEPSVGVMLIAYAHTPTTPTAPVTFTITDNKTSAAVTRFKVGPLGRGYQGALKLGPAGTTVDLDYTITFTGPPAPDCSYHYATKTWVMHGLLP